MNQKLSWSRPDRLVSDLFEVRLSFIDYATDHSLAQILTLVLDQASKLVDSPIGFFHFISPDEKTISLQQWSSATLKHFCRAKGPGLHYDIDNAGIWADCVRERKPVVHNDYQKVTDRKGLPEGHAAIERELVVPVVREGRVVAILGIGNKPTPYGEDDVQIIGYIADVAWEIIKRKQADDMQRLQNKIESSCAKLSAFLLSCRDIVEISLKMLDTARMLTKSEYGFVGSIDRQTGHLVTHSLTRDILESCKVAESAPVFHTFSGLWGWVLENRRPLLTNAAATDSRAQGIPDGHVPIEAFLGVPAMSNGEVVGIIALANPKNIYLDIDLTMAQRLADLYALAIERQSLESELIAAQARRAEELEHIVRQRTAELKTTNDELLAENIQRQEAEAALADEQNMAQNYLNLARVGFVALDRDDRITMINPYLQQVLGYRAEDLVGQDWHSFAMHGDNLAPPAKAITDAIADYPCPSDQQHVLLRTIDDSICILSCSRTEIFDRNNSSIGCLISGEDITEWVKAEQQVRASRVKREILAAIMKNTPLAMVFYVADQDTVKILDWNNSAEKIFGWSKSEVLGRDFMSFLPVAEEVNLVQNAYAMLRDNPGAHNLTNRCNCKSGNTRMIQWFNNSFIEEKSQQIYMVSLGDDITLQHEFDQRLRQSEEQLRTIANFTFDWEDWRGTDGNYIYVSPSCERITGYSNDAFLADSGLTLSIIHPEDRKAITDHLAMEENDWDIHQIDFRIITRTGEIKWISHCCQPVHNEQRQWLGRRSSNRDITDRKIAEQEVTHSRNMLQMVFDGIQDPLVLLRHDGLILMMNTTAGRYFRTAKSIEGDQYCWNLIGTEDLCDRAQDRQGCRNCRILQAIKAGENCNFERAGLIDKSRTEHVFVDIVTSQAGLCDRAVLRIYDTTIIRQMEKDLLQADKMSSLGTLVAGVAHEINNPNNFISLNINLLKEVWSSFKPVLEKHFDDYGDFMTAGLPYSEMREEISNLLIGIEAGSRRIQRIVRELKDYSVPSLDKMDQIININTVVQQAVSLIDSKAAQFTDNFHIEYGVGLPPVQGSSQKLEQVVINLALNACQSITRRADSVHVKTAYDHDSEMIYLTVEDEGIGIEQTMLQQITDPFFTTKRDMGGTGLGLSVITRVISEHHGRLEINSEPGKGSTFTVFLPVYHKPQNNPH